MIPLRPTLLLPFSILTATAQTVTPTKEQTISEAVISVRKKQHERKEQGFSVNVVETQTAQYQQLQTTELLNRSVGVKIRQSGGIGTENAIYINGLSGNSIRLFIDGIPARNYGRSFSITSIPPSLIERIEVYKGTLPSELAEDALGGGINVVLKKDIQQRLSTSYSFGSFDTHQWDLNGAYLFSSGIGTQVSAYYHCTDNNYPVWGDEVFTTDPQTGRLQHVKARRFHDDYRAYGLRWNVGVTNRPWADELLLGVIASDLDKDLQTGATMHRVYGERTTGSRALLGTLQYRKENLLPRLSLATTTTLSSTLRHLTDTANIVYNWLGEKVRNYNGELLHSPAGQGEAGRASLAENTEKNFANRLRIAYSPWPGQTFSINSFYDRFTRHIDDPMLTNEERAALDTRKYHKWIGSLNYDGRFLDNRLRTTIFYKNYRQGVQLTELHYTRDANRSPILSPRKHDRQIADKGYGFTFAYRLLPEVNFTLSGEKAVRLPSTTELLGNTSDMINPNYALLPEKSHNLNIGAQIGAFRWGAHSLEAEVNLFYRQIRDLIIQGVPRESDNSFTFINLGKIRSTGIDIELRYCYGHRLFIVSNASYNDARFNLEYDPYGVRYFYYKSRLRNQPYFTANTNVEYRMDDFLQRGSRLTLNYNFGYTHEFFLNWENLGASGKTTIPSQPLHDIGITYAFPRRHITLALNAKNIFNRQTYDNFALQKPGRAVYGKVTFSW